MLFLMLSHQAVADYVDIEVKFHVLIATLNEDE